MGQSHRQGDETARPLQLRDYVEVLRRRRWLIILMMVLGGALAALYAFNRQPQYVSQASVLVRPIEVDVARTVIRPDQLVNMFTEKEVTGSLAVADRVAERVPGNPSPQRLLDNLSIVVVNDTQVLRISYEDSSPERAQSTAQAFADVYLELREARAEANVASRAEEINEAIVRVDADLLEVNTQISRSEEGSLVRIAAETRRDSLLKQRDELQASLADVESLSVDGGDVISSATLPQNPVSPPNWMIIVIGVIGGFIVGVPLAFARDSLDDRIRSAKDLERAFGFPVLVSIPGFGTWLNQENDTGEPTMLAQPDRAPAESFRRLRSTLLAVARDEAVSSILVTSSVADEGAPNVATDLAIAFAQSGTDVLLISANFQDSAVDRLLGLEDEPGLGDVLLGDLKPHEAVRTVAGVPSTLRVIPSGAQLENPSDALDSPVIEKVLAGHDVPYEFLIVEAPPVVDAADALSLAQLTGGVALCVRSWSSYMSTVDSALGQLDHVRANILGVVLT
jgi:capsular polysaccharide biosynthesis protein/Mrp family chromosome partitioning ATPase